MIFFFANDIILTSKFLFKKRNFTGIIFLVIQFVENKLCIIRNEF